MALPTLRIIGFLLGIFLITLAIGMVVPMLTLLAFERTDDLQAFIWASAITGGCGVALVAPGRPANAKLRPRDMYFLTTASWLVVCCFAALPMMLSRHISYTDAFFETMSGITTTGSTILTGLDDASPGLLMWRSMLHWLGGIGFIGMAVAILPLLRIGGMRLFQTESSDWSEKVVPRSHIAGQYLIAIYVGMTLAAVAAFWLADMSLFDAINHAMSTVSTGGFSTSDASMGKFSPSAHWVAVFFMVLGSLPFTLYVATLRGHRKALIRDQQVRGFLVLVVVSSVLFSGWYWLTHDADWLYALRIVTFNVVSVVTTTGYASGDYTQWGGFAMMVFFYLTFIGGCSGSTTGGLKIFRFQVAYALLRANLKQLIHPRAVIRQQYNGHTLDEDIVRSILTFSFFITITIGALALCLALLGLDLITALTGAASAVCNVGPGLGPIIGPAGNFSPLPDAAKWLLSLGMLLGRLEIITVLVVLTPAFWRH
ncbi:TrkH family potassium uptake protein [Pseudomonas stutzeri]|jgi:trk system potassium uptake protein TrkH|uniref:TrkH family potassium uptake protein n=1 Tax=Pseudomonas TaxID=286 RepID=UPI00051D4A42|nr:MULTISPECIES: TrkH family potassium uptake protein [Pseudomonas]KGK84121.1 potassium transporter TrkH [Stutzerimonas degradans]MDT3709404.1 TrkH family potassium uptake protein [Pseudomonadaceae bacterium]MCQ4233543.1 TrkH family potassium uptake protein [Stutzerimonas degradans]MCQ4268711.1 TrkH family potassium uptake protein [Stutzerimonas degradans]OOE08041.1 potassium transporter TrkH [Stutzerimonas degradans]